MPYKIDCWIPVNAEDPVIFDNFDDAKAELLHDSLLQPRNIHKIVACDENGEEVDDVALSYQEKEVDDECYAKCSTIEQFRDFCEDGGWGDEVGFLQDTGIMWKYLQDKWFQVVHSREYLEEEST